MPMADRMMIRRAALSIDRHGIMVAVDMNRLPAIGGGVVGAWNIGSMQDRSTHQTGEQQAYRK